MPTPAASSATAVAASRAGPRPTRPRSTSGSAASTWRSSGSRKALPAAVDQKRALIEHHDPLLSICRRCELLGLSRSTYYLRPAVESADNLCLMRMIDEQ